MTLHLIKLCVGADSLDDLRQWMAARMAEAKRRGGPLRHAHVTRMTPKRAADILDGGSLYWVIKGQIAARQTIVAIEPFIDSDGIGRCKLWLDAAVVSVAPRPMRAFQGWRYYEAKSAPPDLDETPAGFRGNAGGAAARARGPGAAVAASGVGPLDQGGGSAGSHCPRMAFEKSAAWSLIERIHDRVVFGCGPVRHFPCSVHLFPVLSRNRV